MSIDVRALLRSVNGEIERALQNLLGEPGLDDLMAALGGAVTREAEAHAAAAEARAAEKTMLCDLCCALSFASGPEEIIDVTMGYLAPSGVATGTLVLLDGEAGGRPTRGQVAASWPPGRGFPGDRGIVLGDSPFYRVLVPEGLLLIEDVEREVSLDGRCREALLAAGRRRVVSAPLRLRGRVAGSLLFTWTSARRFSAYELELVRTMADQAPAVMERLLLLEESQRQVSQLERLRGELEGMVRAQQELLRELSTPVIPVAEDVILMPLIGKLDEARLEQAMAVLLAGLGRGRVATAILDLTGVPSMDARAAQGVARVVRAGRLLGADLVVTGVRPDVARTLADLGIPLGDDRRGFTIHATTGDGITFALRRKGPRDRLDVSRGGAMASRFEGEDR